MPVQQTPQRVFLVMPLKNLMRCYQHLVSSKDKQIPLSRINRDMRGFRRFKVRYEALLERYTRQFAVMDALVSQYNSTRTSLQGSFDAMLSMYSNKLVKKNNKKINKNNKIKIF